MNCYVNKEGESTYKEILLKNIAHRLYVTCMASIKISDEGWDEKNHYLFSSLHKTQNMTNKQFQSEQKLYE